MSRRDFCEWSSGYTVTTLEQIDINRNVSISDSNYIQYFYLPDFLARFTEANKLIINGKVKGKESEGDQDMDELLNVCRKSNLIKYIIHRKNIRKF